MKRNIYLTALSVVTILCILIGSGANLGWGFGVWPKGVLHRTGNTELSGDQTVDPFTRIEVEGDVMSLTVEEADSYRVSYHTEKEQMVPVTELKNGTLYVTQDNHGKKAFWGDFHCDVTITVPAGTSLDKLKVELDVGDLSIDGIRGKEMDIQADVGDITLASCDFDGLKVEADVGNIEIGSVKDLEAEGYRVSIASDVGDIELNGASKGKKYDTKGSRTDDTKYVNVTADVGSIKVSW